MSDKYLTGKRIKLKIYNYRKTGRYIPSQQNTICVSTFKDFSIASTDSYKVIDTQNSYFEFNTCSLKRNFATLLNLNSLFKISNSGILLTAYSLLDTFHIYSFVVLDSSKL